MSGITMMLLGGSNPNFIGAWALDLGGVFGSSDYGSALAVGYDGAGAPYAVVSGYGDGPFDDVNFVYRVNLTRTTEWTRTSSADACRFVALDSSYNTYAVMSDPTDTTLVKCSTAGSVTWQRKLSSGGITVGNSVAVDSSGNVVVCGALTATPVTSFVAMYNSSGTIQWQRKLTVTGSNRLDITAVCTDTSGNVILAGTYYESSSGYYRLFVAQYNSSGAIQWQNYDSVSGWDECSATAVTADGSGNIYVTWCYGSAGVEYLFLAKLNSSGVAQWSRSISVATGTAFTRGGVNIDASGNIYASGDNTIIKVNSSGTLQFSRTLSGPAMAVTGLGTDTTEGMWVTGYVTGTTVAVFLARLPDSGNATGTHVIPYGAGINVTYAAGSSLTSRTVSMSTLSATDAAGTLTDAAGGLTLNTFSSTAYTTAV